MNKQAALISIVRAIKKPAHMVEDREYKDVTVLFHHPLSPESAPDFMMISFVGFSSDSIYPFLYHSFIATGPIAQLIFWLCQQAENPRHHQIFAEIKTEFETFLVSGMTDFSGSGSSAYAELRNVFEFLAEIYELEINYLELPPGRDNQAWALINEAAMEQVGQNDE